MKLEKIEKKPKLIILNLDFWWFNKLYNEYDNKDFLYHKNTVNKIKVKSTKKAGAIKIMDLMEFSYL